MLRLAAKKCTQVLSVLLLLITSQKSLPQLVDTQRIEVSSVFASVTALIASISLCGISWLEHRRSTRPSDVVAAYLLACLFRDCLWLFLVKETSQRRKGLLIQALIELVLLIIESLDKSSLYKRAVEPSPEDRASFINRMLFFWVNKILFKGYKILLETSSLPSLGLNLQAEKVRRGILRAWDNRGTVNTMLTSCTSRPMLTSDYSLEMPGNILTLPGVLLRCLLTPFIWAVPARIVLIALKYMQPILIKHAIKLFDEKGTQSQALYGRFLIAGAAVIYIGLAVSLNLRIPTASKTPKYTNISLW